MQLPDIELVTLLLFVRDVNQCPDYFRVLEIGLLFGKRRSVCLGVLAEFSARLLLLLLLNAALTFGSSSISSLWGVHCVILRIIYKLPTKGVQPHEGDLSSERLLRLGNICIELRETRCLGFFKKTVG